MVPLFSHCKTLLQDIMASSKDSLPACRDNHTQVVPEPLDQVVWLELAAAIGTLSLVDPVVWERPSLFAFRTVVAGFGVELTQEILDLVDMARWSDQVDLEREEWSEEGSEEGSCNPGAVVWGPEVLDLAMLAYPAEAELSGEGTVR